jgi:hypothetical protein
MAKVIAHNLLWLTAETAMRGTPRFFPNRPKRRGTHMMIAPAMNPPYCTVIIEPAATIGLWRPVTGWPSKALEIDWYQNAPVQRQKKR